MCHKNGKWIQWEIHEIFNYCLDTRIHNYLLLCHQVWSKQHNLTSGWPTLDLYLQALQGHPRKRSNLSPVMRRHKIHQFTVSNAAYFFVADYNLSRYWGISHLHSHSWNYPNRHHWTECWDDSATHQWVFQESHKGTDWNDQEITLYLVCKTQMSGLWNDTTPHLVFLNNAIGEENWIEDNITPS